MQRSFTVEEYMTPNPLTFSPEMDVLEAIRLLTKRRVSGAPVLDRLGNIAGMLSEKDCMKVAMNAVYHEHIGGTVAEFMHTEVETVEADANIFDVARLFWEGRYRRYPVLKEGRLVGLVSRRDVLRAITP